MGSFVFEEAGGRRQEEGRPEAGYRQREIGMEGSRCNIATAGRMEGAASVAEGKGALPAVSVLISTRGRRELLGKLLGTIRELDYPAEFLEVVVVEETDDPQPPEGVRYLRIPCQNRGYGYTRNVALQNASHEVVAFTDDDCLVERDWLRRLVEPLAQDPELAGVAGAVRVQGDCWLGQCEFILGFPGGGLRYIAQSGGKWMPTGHLSTCNCAYRKAAVLEAGGFELGTRYGSEDSLLARRISQRHRCLFAPQATVRHRPHRSLAEIFRWFVRRGRSEVEISSQAPNRRRYLARVAVSSLSLRAVLLGAAGLALAGTVGAWATLALLALLLAAYYLAMLGRFRYALRECTLVSWLATPMVKAVMDLGMDLGRGLAVREGLHRSRTT